MTLVSTNLVYFLFRVLGAILDGKLAFVKNNYNTLSLLVTDSVQFTLLKVKTRSERPERNGNKKSTGRNKSHGCTITVKTLLKGHCLSKACPFKRILRSKRA
jgi:hypothetical protein